WMGRIQPACDIFGELFDGCICDWPGSKRRFDGFVTVFGLGLDFDGSVFESLPNRPDAALDVLTTFFSPLLFNIISFVRICTVRCVRKHFTRRDACLFVGCVGDTGAFAGVDSLGGFVVDLLEMVEIGFDLFLLDTRAPMAWIITLSRRTLKRHTSIGE